jgi:peptidoglycan hydrolase-like protein with peptidoglycan-binding domain
MHFKHAIAVACAVTLTTAPMAKADLHGVIGAIIGGAILNDMTRQNRTTTNRSSGVSSAQRQENRNVQTALNAFGFPVGTVDGSLGPKSRSAIGNYQAYMGFQSTGYLDDYQKGVLLDGYSRMQAGGGSAFPNVVAAEGTKGLLKAFQDPSYAQRFGAPTFPNPQVAQGQQVATPQAPFGAPQNFGVQPNVPAPVPQTTQVVAPTQTPTPAPAQIAPLTIPPLAPMGQVAKSMAERCELVTLMTQTNQGMVQAAAMTDADQALSEQFCEARSFAISAGQSFAAQLRVSDEQLTATCSQISEAMAPARDLVNTATAQAVQARVGEIKAQIGLSDTSNAAAYGQLCAWIGYRQDNAEMALSGAMLSFAVGQLPYAELMAHHMREGFGLQANAAGSVAWYDTALSALEQGATPAFLPSKSPQRVAVMRAAIKTGQLQAQAGGLPSIVPAAGGGIPALPLPQ